VVKLSFVKKYLSVDAFPDTELPAFVLLTGLNGAGKTHLLQAIAAGDIKADVAPKRAQQIRYFEWNSLIPKDQGLFHSYQLTQQRQSLLDHIDSNRPRQLQRIVEAARNAKLPEEYLTDPFLLARLDEQQLEEILGDPELATTARIAIKAATDVASAKIRNGLSDEAMRELLDTIAEQVNIPIAALKRQQIFETTTPVWGRAEAFQQSFAQLFASYRDLVIYNDLKLRQLERTGRTDIVALDENAFLAQHGPPLWQFVNEAIAGQGLILRLIGPMSSICLPTDRN
jgi:hypothetical protein